MRSIRLALAQINPTVGDIAGNEAKIAAAIDRARAIGAHIVAVPELALPGYPPEDLLLKPQFVAANCAALERIAPLSKDITAIIGFVDRELDIYNAAAVLHDGRIAGVYRKMFLPNYGVFDEDRYFGTGERPLIMQLGGAAIGVNICEDIWLPSGPTELQALAGAQLIINISASPYHAGKIHNRERMWATRAADNVVMVAVCSLVGGQDELVFDGGSVIFDPTGEVIARGRQFVEDFVVADLNLEPVFRQRLHDPRRRKGQPGEELNGRVQRLVLDPVRPGGGTAGGEGCAGIPEVSAGVSPGGGEGEPATGGDFASPSVIVPLLEPVAEVYEALVLGTGDYMRKNGFPQVVIGLSGGIDSSLTAAIAVDALGADNVKGAFMPSQFSSNDSREDAEQLAANLGIECYTIPIQETFEAYLHMMAPAFESAKRDVTEENIQARIRGNILMALSNKFRWLVLTTGNKSELATGYCTLYGDMAGGFAVLKDIPKCLVYELSRLRNARAGGAPVIPERVLTKAPTAELRPNQKDQDSLPPYEVLDPILEAYVEEDRTPAEITAMGFDERTVREVMRLVDRNEYKRRQAAPGVKITSRAFGKDRRLPITNRFREW